MDRHQPIVFWTALLISGCLIGSTGLSQDAAKSSSQAATKPASPKSPEEKPVAKGKPLAAAREAELLTFVQTHHAELGTLLEQLKPAQAAEYQAAIADLDRDVRRLEQIRKRSPKQYDDEVALWVTRSRIRLLLARLSMSEDENLREELRSQLRQLRQLELVAVQQEIGPLQQSIEKQHRKLEKLQQRLRDLQSNDDDWLAKQLTELKQKPASKPASKPAAKSKQKSSVKPSEQPSLRPALEE